jgi:hypothetical protein
MIDGVTEPPTDVTAGTVSASDRSGSTADELQGSDVAFAHESSPDAASPDPDATAVAGRRKKRRVDKSIVIVCGIVALGFALVVNGVLSGVTGDDRANLPTLIEDVQPVPEAVQALSQSNVFVDLAANYTGVLVIDGVEIETVNVDEIGSIQVEPGQQVDLPPVTIYEPGNATLTFTPSAGAPIETFGEGVHQVQVIYWRIDQGRQRARSFGWTFTVV